MYKNGRKTKNKCNKKKRRKAAEKARAQRPGKQRETVPPGDAFPCLEILDPENRVWVPWDKFLFLFLAMHLQIKKLWMQVSTLESQCKWGNSTKPPSAHLPRPFSLRENRFVARWGNTNRDMKPTSTESQMMRLENDRSLQRSGRTLLISTASGDNTTLVRGC